MTKVRDLHQKWMKSVEYREAYEALAPEFELARAVIDARVTAGLTQEQLAKRMETTQSVIARLESGRTRPSTQTQAFQGLRADATVHADPGTPGGGHGNTSED